MNLQLTMAARYLRGRKLRTFLTTLAVVFGVLVLFGMNIILPTMMQSLQLNALAATGMVDVTITHASGEAFPADTLAKVKSVDGVRVASASLNRTINLPADFVDQDPAVPDAISALSLVGVDPFDAKSVRSYPIVSGRYLEASDGVAAVISRTLADALHVDVGGTFSLPTAQGVESLIVAGILPARTVPGNEEVLVTLAQAQQMANQPGVVNAIDANLTSMDEAERQVIVQAIEAALGPGYKTGSLMAGSEMFASLKLGQAAMSLFGVLALFMGAFIIFNTFRTVVVERRRDIGMLRAVGASRRMIVGLILAEGLLQGVLGTALGLALGYLMGAGIIQVLGPLMSSFLNLKMGAVVISPGNLIASVVLGIGVTVFAGLLPALSAGRVTPLEALRPAVADTSTGRRGRLGLIGGIVLIVLAVLALLSENTGLLGLGSLLFLVGLVLVAPALVRPIATVLGKTLAFIYARRGIPELASGNLARQPSRVATTASATMLGLAIVVAAGGMVSSLTITINDVLKKSLGSDYLFIPPSIAVWTSNLGSKAEFAESLRQQEGVAEVNTLRFAPSLAEGQSVSLMGIDPVTFPQVSGMRFQENLYPDEASAYRALGEGRAMIANGAFMGLLGAKLGDTVELLTPQGKSPYRIVAVAADMLNVKITTGYISQAAMKDDFGKTEDVFIQLNLRPGADAASTDAGIRSLAMNYPQFRVIAGREYLDSMMAQMDAAFAGMYVMLAFLAVPSLIAMLNTLAIGVIERTREIGTLRAVGATRKQVRSMVVTEALLLAAIGTAFGLLAGLYLGYTFIRALGAMFPLGYAFPAAGMIAAIAIGLLFGVFAALIPARQAAKMNVVEALRYE